MALSRQEKRLQKRRAIEKRKTFLIISGLAFVLLVMVLIYTVSIKKTADANEARLERLENQVEEQNVRKEELEKQSIYMQSIDFIEKIARERLGLVGEDETVIKPEN